MESCELRPVEDGGELVSTGTFLTDRQYLEKRADSELIKIANQELMPYKMYLGQSLKVHISLTLGALLFGIVTFLNYSHTFLFGALLVITLCFSSVEIGMICVSEIHFPIFPILKLYRAKKLFGQAMEELRTEILAGKADITKLNTLFHERVQFILDERAINIQNKSSMISKARNSRI